MRMLARHLEDMWKDVQRRRRDMLRIALQTALAASITYGVMRWTETPDISSAVIAALFTIELSVDTSYSGAIGRMVGALLGVGFGLIAGWTLGPIVLSLAISAALANAVATVWPSLRYAAVTAAIVALEPVPQIGGGLTSAMAILIGAGIGAAASLAIWPVFGRQRAATSLQATLDDCIELLNLIISGAGRRRLDALHARFLTHLQTVHTRISETRFRRKLPCGTSLRDAAIGVETFWHSLVLLDRVLSAEDGIVERDAIERLRPTVAEMQAAADEFLCRLHSEIDSDHPEIPELERLQEATAAAREVAEKLDREYPGPDGLHAVAFALGEVERRLVEFAAAFGDTSADPETRSKQAAASV